MDQRFQYIRASTRKGNEMNPPSVDFRDEYPTGHVAEHEVFMSFNGDSEAIAFREWWDEQGEKAFAKWYAKNQRQR